MKLTRIDGRKGPRHVEVQQTPSVGVEPIAKRGVFVVPSGYEAPPSTNGAQIEEKPGRPYSVESMQAVDLGWAPEERPQAAGPYAEQINWALEYVNQYGMPERDEEISRPLLNNAENAVLRIMYLVSDRIPAFREAFRNQARVSALDTLAQSPQVATATRQLPRADFTETVMEGNRAVSHSKSRNWKNWPKMRSPFLKKELKKPTDGRIRFSLNGRLRKLHRLKRNVLLTMPSIVRWQCRKSLISPSKTD